jgi:DNA-binding GntR family transcriptional regulator
MAFEEASVTQELLSDKVYVLVRRAILDGTQAPGSRLVESEIARSLGVSQAPVRDAIKRLAHEGLVTSLPRRGSYVTELSADEFTIGRELRAKVEQIGAEMVAKDTEADTSRLRTVAENMVQAADADDRAELRLLDMQFHRTAVELAGNALIVRAWSVMEPSLISQHVIGDPNFTGDWGAVARDHVRLVDLLDANDPKGAGKAFYIHAIGQGQYPPRGPRIG